MSPSERDGSLSDWLARFGISWPGRQDPLWSRSASSRTGGTYPSRALRRYLEVLRAIEHPVLLDLGPAAGQTVSFFGHELDCKLVVADLVTLLDESARADADADRSSIIRVSLDLPVGQTHGILCWDVFDYLTRDEASTLVLALERILSPGGVLLAMFSTLEYGAPEVTRYAVEEVDRIAYRPTPAAMAPRGVRHSRDISRLFSGLRVDETYLLSHGQREVLVRKPKPAV